MRMMSFVAIALTMLLTGCAGGIPLEVIPSIAADANAMRGDQVKVSVKAGGESDQAIKVLKQAKRVEFLVADNVSMYVARVFERNGVAVKSRRLSSDGSTTVMLESEVADMFKESCASGRADVVVMLRLDDQKTSHMAMDMVTGRSSIQDIWRMGVMDCSTKSKSSIAGTTEYDVGGFSNEIEKMEQYSGEGIGNRILEAAGIKTIANQGKVTDASAATDSSRTQYSPKVVTIKDAQERLNAIGYNVGKADGVVGKKTKEQIRAFQKSKGLKQTGTLDAETMSALNN